jgi:AcrR family transcriptional regulator
MVHGSASKLTVDLRVVSDYGRELLRDEQGIGEILRDSSGSILSKSGTSVQRLLRTAIELFAERGFHGTTVRAICQAADAGETAVYDHFASKEDMLYVIMRVAHGEAIKRLNRARDTAPTGPDAQLWAVTHAFVAFHAECGMVTRVANHELGALSEQHRRDLRRVRREVETFFEEALEYGIAGGAFDVAADIRTTVFAIVSICIGVSRWYRLDGRLSPDELGRQYADFVTRLAR